MGLSISSNEDCSIWTRRGYLRCEDDGGSAVLEITSGRSFDDDKRHADVQQLVSYLRRMLMVGRMMEAGLREGAKPPSQRTSCSPLGPFRLFQEWRVHKPARFCCSGYWQGSIQFQSPLLLCSPLLQPTLSPLLPAFYGRKNQILCTFEPIQVQFQIEHKFHVTNLVQSMTSPLPS